MLKLPSHLAQGTERMTQSARGKADCVPVYAQVSAHAARLAGETTRQFFTDARTFLRCQFLADDLYRLDALTIHYDVYNIEAQALGAPLLWAGDECPEIDPSRPLLTSPGDFRKLRPPRMGRDGRMPFVLELNRILCDLGVGPKIRFCGLFTLAAKLLGFENLIASCITEPEEIHALMTWLTDEVVGPWIAFKRQDCGCNGPATGADALASPPILSPPLIREFCLRYIQRLERQTGNIRLAGLWGEHCLAEPRQLMDIKREGCPAAMQALDPDVTALGPSFFKRYADEHKMAITMGIDATLIQSGPAQAISARARRFIDEAGQDGRFVLYMNDIPYHTPSSHVHAVVEAAHGHRY